MNLQQKQGLDRFAKIKYSKIDGFEANSQTQARVAIGYLMKNGYTCMNGSAINEIHNLIRSLRELRIEYTMKTIETQGSFFYEFTLGYFEDDRT